MDEEFLKKFELKEMLQHPDFDDEEGMLYLSAKLRELPSNNRARTFFDRYCETYKKGQEQFNLTQKDLLDEHLQIAKKHPKIDIELRAIAASAGWYMYYNNKKGKNDEN